MKKIAILSILFVSLFSMSCGSDASTCAESVEIVEEECKNSESITLKPTEEAIASCNEDEKKEEIIECSNAGDCSQISGCLLGLAFGI